MPGSPGGPIPESLREAGKQASERPVAAVRPEQAAKPTTAEQKLREDNEELRRELAELKRRSAAEAKQRAPEAQPETEDNGERSPVRPEREVRIKDIGEKSGLSFFERMRTGLAAQFEDAQAGIAAMLARKNLDTLKERNKKIEEWEHKAEESGKGSWTGMGKSMLWDAQWANYHRWRGQNTYRTLEGYNDSRTRHENARNDILDQGAARIDRLLDSILERIDQYALLRQEEDKKLAQFHEDHKELTETLALAENKEERNAVRVLLDDLELEMKEAVDAKRDATKHWQDQRKRANVQQRRKEALLGWAKRPNRTATTPPPYEWLVQRDTRLTPVEAPKARAKATRIKKLVV
jgi:hypothetical protein